MSYQFLQFDVADRIATITVNRPDKLNALNDATIAELGRAIDEANAREDVGAVLLTGAGRAFVAGADISELESQSPLEALQRARAGQQRGHAAVQPFDRHPVVEAGQAIAQRFQRLDLGIAAVAGFHGRASCHAAHCGPCDIHGSDFPGC